MAEESENPTRNVPRALIGSVLLFGIFIVIVQWGVMIGWGTDNFQGMAEPGIELPGITLAKQFWSSAWGLLLLMLISSVIAVSIACANVSTRMWYRMGTDGAFPRWFGKVHPVRKTPTNAIIAQWVLAIATAVVLTTLAYTFTPADAGGQTLVTAYQNQYYMDGYMIGYVVLIIYTMGNIAAWLLYRGERRNEYSVWLHTVFPILSTLGMLLVLLFSLGIIGGDPLGIHARNAAGGAVQHRGHVRRRVVHRRRDPRVLPALERPRELDEGRRRGRGRAAGHAGRGRSPQGRMVSPGARPRRRRST